MSAPLPSPELASNNETSKMFSPDTATATRVKSVKSSISAIAPSTIEHTLINLEPVAGVLFVTAWGIKTMFKGAGVKI